MVQLLVVGVLLLRTQWVRIDYCTVRNTIAMIPNLSIGPNFEPLQNENNCR